jgi:hypothetical protein
MIKDNGDYIQLDVIVEKFRKKVVNVKIAGKPVVDDNGNKVKEEVEEYYGDILVPTNFYKTDIRVYGMTPNHRYRVQKTKSTIFDRSSNKFYVVKHTLDEIRKGLDKRSIVGFQVGKNEIHR